MGMISEGRTRQSLDRKKFARNKTEMKVKRRSARRSFAKHGFQLLSATAAVSRYPVSRAKTCWNVES